MELDTIHLSLVNGQRRQMKEQIEEYGLDFWADYKAYLLDIYPANRTLEYFSDAVISFNRLESR